VGTAVKHLSHLIINTFLWLLAVYSLFSFWNEIQRRVKSWEINSAFADPWWFWENAAWRMVAFFNTVGPGTIISKQLFADVSLCLWVSGGSDVSWVPFLREWGCKVFRCSLTLAYVWQLCRELLGGGGRKIKPFWLIRLLPPSSQAYIFKYVLRFEEQRQS